MDPLSLVFLGCFLFGLLFFVVTALLGNLGHGHAVGHTATHQVPLHMGGHASSAHVAHVASHPASGPGGGTTHTSGNAAHAHGPLHQGAQSTSLLSHINVTSVALFLLGFGFFGFVFLNVLPGLLQLTLILAAIGGVIIAVLVLLLLSRLFGNSEGATVQDISDRTGMVGKVSTTIQENGLGEIIYISPGGMRKSIPARSADGRRLEREQEVVVVNYEHGIAEVDTWDHFINEEGHYPEPSVSDELAKLRALLDESSDSNTELVIRKDQQKE
jgi:membrane protein implicated in regulation of membrane protease activity